MCVQEPFEMQPSPKLIGCFPPKIILFFIAKSLKYNFQQNSKDKDKLKIGPTLPTSE